MIHKLKAPFGFPQKKESGTRSTFKNTNPYKVQFADASLRFNLNSSELTGKRPPLGCKFYRQIVMTLF